MQFVPVPSPVSRLFVALLALLLLPLTALLYAAPAQAAPGVADGAVYDALGDPLAGVTVDALAAPAFTAVVSTATSDAEGAYSLSLADGSYRLRFSKTDYVTAFYGDGVQVDVDEGALSVDGEPLEDNLLGDVTMTSTAQHTVSGTVRNAENAPLAGIDVAIYTAGDDETPVDTATTTGAGGYELQVPTGIYHVRFTDAGGTYLPTWYGGAEPEDVTVTGARTLDQVTLATPPPASEYPIAGTVTDANGDPVAAVSVTVTGVGATSDSGTDTTTAEGDYSVTVLPGTYQVGFAKTGFLTTTYGDNGAPATVTVANNGTLSVSGGAEPIGNRLDDVTLSSTAFAVTGVVETTGNTGIVGITVRAFPQGSTDPAEVVDTTTSGAGGSYTLDLPIGTYDLEFADNDGAGTTYTTASLAAVKVAQGGALSVGDTPVAGLPDVQMAVSSADTPHPVVGSVVDANYNEIDGVTVSAVPQGATPGANATSDVTGADGELGDHGRYRLMLKPGTYHLEVEGGADWADTTYVGEGTETALVTVQLNGTVLVNGVQAVGGELGTVSLIGTTNYPLTGTVTDGSTALGGITVAVYTEGSTEPGSELATTTTSGTGSYTFQLPVGSYVLRYSGSSGGTLYTARWFGAGAAPGTPVQMGQAGVISVDGDTVASLPVVVMTVAGAGTPHALPGDVVDNNYDGLPGVLVTAVAQPGGAVTDTATSDGDGHFELDLVPGSYQVKYEKSGYPLTWYPDPDDEGAHATVVVALDGTMKIGVTTLTEGLDAQVLLNPAVKHPISGTVVDEADAGLSGITVQALVEGTSDVAATVTSTAGGAYTLQVPVGTYDIRFTDNVVAEPTYSVTYFGGETPTPVKVATGGQLSVNDANVAGLTPVTMSVVAADVRYDLKGVVYDAVYDPLNGVAVEVIPVAGTDPDNDEGGTTGPDPVTGAGTLGDAGVYRIPTRPGKYQLRFSKTGYQTTYLASFDDLTKPVTVTVAANGTITAPGLEVSGGILDDVQLLLPAPTVVTAPKLTGKVVVGQVVTATVGTWNPDIADIYPDWQDSTYVEWFLDGKPADRYSSGYYGQKFKVPAAAATKKLSFRITIDDPNGERASASFTSQPVAVPKAPSSLKAAYKKGKLTVTVTVPTLKTPTGKITVLDGKKKVGKGTLVTKSKGVVVITLAKLKKGKHKLTVKYAGTATIAASKVVVRIKV